MRSNQDYAALLRLARKLVASITYVDEDGMHEHHAVTHVGRDHAITLPRDENGILFGTPRVMRYDELSWLSTTIGGETGQQYHRS